MAEIITEDSITTAIWNKMHYDSEIQELVGRTEDIVHLVWAKKDNPLPYLVHRLVDRSTDHWTIRDCPYYLDIWDYNPQATRVYKLLSRVKELLDKSYVGFFNEGEDPYFAVVKPSKGEYMPDTVIGRVNYDTGDFIPEETEGIWHYATVWNIRFSRSPQEIQKIIGE